MEDGHDDDVETREAGPAAGRQPTVRGARRFARDTAGPRKIVSAAKYVGVCRRLQAAGRADPSLGPLAGEGRVDGRLVAAGWNRFSPTDWVRQGENGEPSRLASFLAYWDRAVARPRVVGSSCNTLDTRWAFEVWRAGVPAWIAGALGGRLRNGRRVSQSLPLWRTPERKRERRLTRAALAARRASVRYAEFAGWRFSTSTLAMLGRLDPEEQATIVRASTTDPNAGNILTPSRLAWAAGVEASRKLAGDSSGRVRLALAVLADPERPTRRRIEQLHPNVTPFELPGVLAPAYPGTTVVIAARLALGESPAAISGGLTRAEAHAWLTKLPSGSAVSWLASQLPETAPFRLRSIVIVRWLHAVQRRDGWGALIKERVVHGPAGQEIRFRFLDRIDEIQDEDLVRGSQTRVVDAFESAAGRAGESWLAKNREDHRVIAGPVGWKFSRRIRRLVTPAALVAEGEEMSHCVGGYATAVEKGQSHVLSIRAWGQRSTVELAPEGRVSQHSGPRNAPPHAVCVAVLRRFLARNRLGGIA